MNDDLMRYSLAKKTLHLSAHDFAGTAVEVVAPSSFRLRMKAGQSIHREYQSRIPENANAEVPVRIERMVDGWQVVVRGKADVVIRENDLVVVEEIKSVRSDEELPEYWETAVTEEVVKEIEEFWRRINTEN